MGSAEGAQRTAAARTGHSVTEYLDRLNAGLRWCFRDQAWEPVSEFGKDASRSDGLARSCRQSINAANRKRTDRPGTAERRRMRDQGFAWCSGDCQAWLPAEQVTKTGQCRPCVNTRYRAAYASDGAAIRAQKAARKRGLDVVPQWWQTGRLGGPCAYGCGREATTLDHIWPVALGGQSRPGNLAPACVSCNSSKRDNHPSAWVERGREALPDLWIDLFALALEHGTDEWTEAA